MKNYSKSQANVYNFYKFELLYKIVTDPSVYMKQYDVQFDV